MQPADLQLCSMWAENCPLYLGPYGAAVADVCTVKTASEAIAMQIVWSTRRGSRQIEHLGSAHDDAGVEARKAAARQPLAEGQGTLEVGLDTTGVDGEPLEIVASNASHLSAALCRAYQALGFR
jgi:hypothetical protein